MPGKPNAWGSSGSQVPIWGAGHRVRLAALAWLLASVLPGQTYEVLHSFDPITPFLRSALIADASGNLYGTTSSDGPSGLGTVFRLDASNDYARTILHAFDGVDGRHPNGALVADASGNLYGTTYGDYSVGDLGTVFRLDASNDYALTTLHNFDGLDGARPTAALILDASGNLYGTTSEGGPSFVPGDGTVFKLDAANDYALTTLHSFDGSDGRQPSSALLADAAGNLYGTTSSSVGPGYGGTVFKLDAANNYELATLHHFDGAQTYATLIADASGNLYGTTAFGGSDHGTVFRLDALHDYALKTLHTFGGFDGDTPFAGVIADASGNLYGTTFGPHLNGYGTIFKLDAEDDYALTTLHAFGYAQDPDGAYPYAAVFVDASGNLYGTTTAGGLRGGGTAYRLDAADSYALTTLCHFEGAGGRGARAGLSADASGNLYGTTELGGAYGAGTVFKIDPANNYAMTTLHDFDTSAGYYPAAGVIADAAGNLYGTTFVGGAHGLGTVFKLDAANYALTTLHSFDGLDGMNPYAAVLADAAGNLYGTTGGNESSNYGTVFKLDAANGYALTTLHHFTGPDGAYPWAAVIADAAGNLYGTTKNGGSTSFGTVFKLDAANNYAHTTLHTFDVSEGLYPVAPLLIDAAGNLYGTTAGNGNNYYGTVFKLDAANNYAHTSLHTFDGFDGAGPYAGVIADSAGNLYGTTVRGTSAGGGTIFQLDAANGYALTTLHAFHLFDGTGHSSFAALFADTSGKLLGTTYRGGVNETGVVFALTTGEPAPVTGISPTSGPSGGGTAVAITGSGFAAAANVWIGGAPATEVAVVGSTEIAALTPVLPPGRLNDVAVANPTFGPSVPNILPGAFFSDFLDVPQADIFHDDVETVFRAGITAGCGAGYYCRSNPVTRAQMAVFLLKSQFGASHVPPACTGGVFTDVPCTGSPFDPWIEELAALGITGGCGGDLYCPGSSVTRQQMSALLLKTLEGSEYVPPACTPQFDDVPCPSQFADWIGDLSGRGITGGCGGDNYCPSNPVTRGQMAALLVKTFNLQ